MITARTLRQADEIAAPRDHGEYDGERDGADLHRRCQPPSPP